MKNKVWIFGPCSLESRDLFSECIKTIDSIMDSEDDWYMKASFDKANRTSLHGGRGPGLEVAKEVWAEAKELYPNIKFSLLI
jgi:2-dehydro-3-deoxyphosphooctonate aldolase (KDO 8-P synthase)